MEGHARRDRFFPGRSKRNPPLFNVITGYWDCRITVNSNKKIKIIKGRLEVGGCEAILRVQFCLLFFGEVNEIVLSF